MKHSHFFCELEEAIRKKHLLNHSFYKAWTAGLLSRECLQDYAKEYYHHVKAFPTYLSALHCHTHDIPTRKAILQNLVEEEAGSPNHPELWREFALNLGVSQKELDAHEPCVEMKTMIETFRNICLKNEVSEGLAALYSYESQIPAVSQSKIEGLKSHYQMNHKHFWRYFSVHIEADIEHSKVERELLQIHINDNNSHLALASAKQALTVLWNFLSYLVHRHNIHCA